MIDQYERNINYLRISITDRCNLRCKYCMPEDIEWVKMDEILSYEEIIEVVKAASKLGIEAIKITGGEPLVRKGCCDLIKRLKQIEGIKQVTITTNGVLLKEYAKALKDAGIDGINVSLDILDRKMMEYITTKDVYPKIMEGIKEAVDLNIPLKINAVSFDMLSLAKKAGIKIKKDYWIDLINLTKELPIQVRFIEVMPIGTGQNYETIDHKQLFKQIEAYYGQLTKDNVVHGNGPAIYYHIKDYRGSIGFISAIHGKFCDSCNRVRMTSMGYLKSCLCFDDGCDLRKILRNNDQEELMKALSFAIYNKPKAHHFENKSLISETKKMSSIGG